MPRPVALGLCRALAVGALAATGLAAQTPAPPPVRELGPVVGTATVAFKRVSGIVSLPSGGIFVNDPTQRRLFLFDSNLSSKIVFDSAGGQKNSYPSTTATLFAFRGDSALWYDRSAEALIVLGPDGAPGRIMAPPGIPSWFSANNQFGPVPFTSSAHGLVFSRKFYPPGLPAPPPGQGEVTWASTDSAFVIRMHFDTRAIDTVSKIAAGGLSVNRRSATGSGGSFTTPMFAYADETVATTDGSLAIYHSHENRVERLHPDGTRSSAKIPYAWRRFPDDVRDHIIDSVNKQRRFIYDSTLAQWKADSANGTLRLRPVIAGDAGLAAGRGPSTISPPPAVRIMTPDEFPDYYPATKKGALMADGDNNVWLRLISTTPDPRGTVWTVVDPSGAVVDRVVIPIEATVAGFGRGGIIYLWRSDAGVPKLQKVRWR